jgi:hypothetical protein
MIALADQIAELRRELALRTQVYPKFVASGRLRQKQADQQVARMTAALETLVKISEGREPINETAGR